MSEPIVVRGTLRDPSHIELEEPVPNIHGRVEVTLRSIRELTVSSAGAILRALATLPEVKAEDVDELESMIEKGKLQSPAGGLFDTDHGR
jgi:hypothetical protein